MRTRSSFLVLLATLSVLTACTPPRQQLVLLVQPADRPLIDEFAALLPALPIELRTSTTPADEARSGDGAVRAALSIEPLTGTIPCAGCYRIERTPDGGEGVGFVVRGSDALGVQYGLAHLLEAFGIRFFHPSRAHVPEQPFQRDPDETDFGRLMKPDQALRGLHLHTMHPIEAYYALWEPGEQNLLQARRIVDWIVKNRGNYLQWAALDDILAPGADVAAWRAHTRAVIDYAHRRGLRTGVAIQLFGFSDLQKGFDLVDDKAAPVEGQIRERLQFLLTGLSLDHINLSFGEFFGTDPKQFIESVDLTYRILQELAPGTGMSATVHVGDSPKQKVDYMGEKIIYYFLVKYADPAIVPWLHTVMYYDLFEDAGGAYHHQDFAAHREYLLSRLRAGQRVGYKPESAYWVAFDNSVPTYLPLYIRSRYVDMAEVRRAVPAAALPEHVLFSSGWEWGYWQNDYATLRMGYALPADWSQPVAAMFAPFGPAGEAVTAQIRKLGEVEHDALITQRLAPYLAGRDLLLDAGRQAGILSQPDRPALADIAHADPAAQARFAETVLGPLDRFAQQLGEIRASLDRLGELPLFLAEVKDGTAVTALRARFIHAIYRAALESSRGGDAAPWLASADAALAEARTVVERRKSRLLLPGPAGERLSAPVDSNATIYQWGYLKQAHTLCYWERERIEVRREVMQTQEPIPPCVF